MLAVDSPESFWQAARYQRVCAICGRAGGRPDFRGRIWHAHHTVPRQLLRRLGLPEWDPRGALRICTDCHMQDDAGALEVRHLTAENICYAWEVLGVTVVQLERKYGDFDHDPRWHRHHLGECGLCQLT